MRKEERITCESAIFVCNEGKCFVFRLLQIISSSSLVCSFRRVRHSQKISTKKAMRARAVRGCGQFPTCPRIESLRRTGHCSHKFSLEPTCKELFLLAFYSHVQISFFSCAAVETEVGALFCIRWTLDRVGRRRWLKSQIMVWLNEMVIYSTM